jgi:DNA-binding LytR/AlgR family response regulator
VLPADRTAGPADPRLAARLRDVPATPPDWKNVLAQLGGALRQPAGLAYPERIASRLGERIQLLEVARITHCFARDKLTYAAVDGKNYVVDHTVAELEAKLDPRQFVRIHRSTLVNIAWVREIDAWFGWEIAGALQGCQGHRTASVAGPGGRIEATHRCLSSSQPGT